jgi:hypothetical protein
MNTHTLFFMFHSSNLLTPSNHLCFPALLASILNCMFTLQFHESYSIKKLYSLIKNINASVFVVALAFYKSTFGREKQSRTRIRITL